MSLQQLIGTRQISVFAAHAACSRLELSPLSSAPRRFGSAHQAIFDQPNAGAFFNKAFTNGFKETRDGVLELPEEDTEMVRGFVEMLYGCRTVPIGSPNCEPRIAKRQLEKVEEALDVYSFAHRYMLHEVQNTMASRIFRASHTSDFPSVCKPDALRHFFDSVPEPSPMHTLLAKWAAVDTFTHETINTDDFEKWPGLLLMMVLKEGRSVFEAWRDTKISEYVGFNVDYHVPVRRPLMSHAQRTNPFMDTWDNPSSDQQVQLYRARESLSTGFPTRWSTIPRTGNPRQY